MSVKVSVQDQDFSGTDIQDISELPDGKVEVEISKQAISRIPNAGEWAVVSIDDEIITTDDISDIKLYSDTVKIIVPK